MSDETRTVTVESLLIDRVDGMCLECRGTRFTVTADPTEQGEPGEPYQVQCWDDHHALADDLRAALAALPVATAGPDRMAALEGVATAALNVVVLPPHIDAYSTEDRRRIWTAALSEAIDALPTAALRGAAAQADGGESAWGYEQAQRAGEQTLELADLRTAVEIMDTKITPSGEREDGTTRAYIVPDSTWHRVLAIARGSTSENARKSLDEHRRAAQADTAPGLAEAWAAAEAAIEANQTLPFRAYVRGVASGYEAGMSLPEMRGGQFVRSEHPTPVAALLALAARLAVPNP